MDEQIFEECQHLSIMGPKLRPLIKAARRCYDVPGDVVEVGVYRGGSGLALCRVFDMKKVWMIDTFTGIPEDDALPGGHKAGDFGDTSLDKVCDVFYQKDVTNALPVKGDARELEVLKPFFDRRFSFLHLDADIQQSTKECVNFFVPRLNPRGGVFFDDYGSKQCPFVKPLVDDLMASGRFWMTHELGTAFLKLK